MELHIQREQVRKSKKGLLSSGPGYVEFILRAKLILSGEEANLLETYKDCWSPSHNVFEIFNQKYTVFDLVKGLEFRNNGIFEICSAEDQIRTISKKLVSRLDLAYGFEGNEVLVTHLDKSTRRT